MKRYNSIKLFNPYFDLSGIPQDHKETFISLEKHCYREGNSECLAEHDSYKLAVSELSRKQERELVNLASTCQHFLSVESTDLAFFKSYRDCLKPFIKNYQKYVFDEAELIKEANEHLSKLAV